MSWMSRLMDVVVIGLFGTVIVLFAVLVFYLPSLARAEIEYKRAAAKALSGLDIGDEETRRVLHGLFGQDKGSKDE